MKSEWETLKLKIQHAFWNHEISVISFSSQLFNSHEIMLQAKYFFLDQQAILYQQFNVKMHYSNESLLQSTSTDSTLICRLLLNKKRWLQSLAFSVLHQEELEIKKYDCEYFRSHFNAQKDNRCLSLSYLLFLNDFDLYWNFYRSLMSAYLILASFDFHERIQHINVFLITLELHESNLNEVLNILSSLSILNKKAILKLLQSTWVCIFSLCMIKDMSQQQANAKFKLQQVKLDCHFCLISSESRDELDFDIITNNRFHNQTMKQRCKISRLSAVTKKEIFAIKWDLTTEKLTLLRLFSALDVILTRFSDFAHSEYTDLCKQLHHLLLKVILMSTATQSYAIAICKWLFASDFAQIQSSLHHLKSYNLLKHARWIVMISALLKCWLKKKHLQSYYHVALQMYVTVNVNDFITIEIIIRIFELMTKSTSLLMTDKLEERA